MAKTSADLSSVDVAILCGGLGTRLQAIVPNRPKALALVGGRPFLDILVDELVDQGFRRIIFCVGHLKEQIIAHYVGRPDAEFMFSEENEPLGTGGALKNALPLIRSDQIVVLNGDSLCRVEFHSLYRYHIVRSATATFVLTAPDERHDGGTVRVDETRRVLSFAEKSGRPDSHCFINAGIYMFDVGHLSLVSRSSSFSLEHDVFPALVLTHPCFGFVVEDPLIDIGTPQRYREANDARWDSHKLKN